MLAPTTSPPSLARRALLLFCAFTMGLFCLSVDTPADVLKLRSGGEVDGILINPDEAPRTKYVMRLETGGEITIAAADVKSFLPLSEAQKRYRALLKKMPATAEANWIVADWCKDKGLRNERKFHLEAAIQMDPEHAQARAALGYSLRDGVWKRREDFQIARKETMLDRGYQLYGGSWRLPQDVALEKKRIADDLAIKKWTRDVIRWRTWIGKRKEAEAIAAIKAIDDPRAAPALNRVLKSESNTAMARLYVKTLAKLPSAETTKSLVTIVLSTSDLDLRDDALEALDQVSRDLAVDAFIHSLSDSDNTTINRAAIGLQRLVEPRATRPLIDALVTEHKTKVGQDNPGQLSTSFGSGASGNGIGFGAGSRPRVVSKTLQNPAVLDALLLLSDGANFDYDQSRWRDWWALRDTPNPDLVDLRRDP